jgi:asparagine synthase (glutamine-hydrolysing)
MFAVGLVDQRQDLLVLARDRFGEKPLYFTQQAGVFAFASEIGALRWHPALRFEFDARAVQKFLACGFLAAPQTVFRDIHKIPAGGILSFRRDAARPTIRRYWEFLLEPRPDGARRDERAVLDEFQQHLHRAVQRRLMSDVPLGVFLSGGLDSSAVLQAAVRARNGSPVRTFTIGFAERSFDETAYAAEVAGRCQAEHHVQCLSMAGALELVDHVLGRMDEPIADPSILPTFLLSRFTREHVTVALSGDGGDELLAGYDPFRALPLARAFACVLPPATARLLGRMAEYLPKSDRNMSFDLKVRRMLAGLTHPVAMWNPVWIGPVAPGVIARLFDDPLPPEELYAEPVALWNRSADLSVPERTLEFFTRFYLTENILLKVDRAAMMNSLESRAVFLDNDLVDFCRHLPYRFKYARGQTKVILRRSLHATLPRRITSRGKKGFGIPLSAWLRAMPAERFRADLPGLRSNVVDELHREHQTRRADHRGALWCLLSLAASVAGDRPSGSRGSGRRDRGRALNP